MLDSDDVAKIRREIRDFENSKIKLNDVSRRLVRASKLLIYSLHRGDGKHAKLLKDLKGLRGELDKVAKTPKLRHVGAYGIGVQEYVEAAAYESVLSRGKIPTHVQLKAEADQYVMGLSDLTGELMRKTIDLMIRGDYKKALTLREAISDICEAVLSLDLGGGEARKKSDQIKYNLNRVEDAIFEAKIKDKI
ncbi:MAG TPA: hypothetical protein ENN13_00205 [Candidatus Altiarchaeales archaeon]|nr:hypothetical protein [Candidatus Altiarchaeales archaeon]